MICKYVKLQMSRFHSSLKSVVCPFLTSPGVDWASPHGQDQFQSAALCNAANTNILMINTA